MHPCTVAPRCHDRRDAQAARSGAVTRRGERAHWMQEAGRTDCGCGCSHAAKADLPLMSVDRANGSSAVLAYEQPSSVASTGRVSIVP
jgi:hypothetical protein